MGSSRKPQEGSSCAHVLTVVATQRGRRAGLGGAGDGLTVVEVAPHTTWKSSEPKTELEDLTGLLQGRGQGALPGVSRWRPSHLFGRKRQRFLHCVRMLVQL